LFVVAQKGWRPPRSEHLPISELAIRELRIRNENIHGLILALQRKLNSIGLVE
jgi:hypothetical protein